MGIVVDFAARHEGLKVRRQAFKFQPGHETSQVVGVRSDVAGRPTGAGARRIGAPFGLFDVQLFGQPVLGIFRLNHADIAQIAVCHHFAALAAPSDSRCNYASG